MKFKTQWNAEEFPAIYETKPGLQASLTIPDQTMSIRTIMDRFARGLPVEGQKVPLYHGEEMDLSQFRAMDLSELAELREANAELLMRLQAQAVLDYQDKEKKPKPEELPAPDPNQTKLPL